MDSLGSEVGTEIGSSYEFSVWNVDVIIEYESMEESLEG